MLPLMISNNQERNHCETAYTSTHRILVAHYTGGRPFLHQSTLPFLTQKWQPQAFRWWTEGVMLGRRHQSRLSCQHGR